MRSIILYILLFLILLASCRNDPAAYATRWTAEMKQRILADTLEIPDSTFFDSTGNSLWFFKQGKKVKAYLFERLYDSLGKPYLDTSRAYKIFYSKDQQFELDTVSCGMINQNSIFIRYQYYYYGLVEFRYCNGNIQKRGFRYKNEDVGIWNMYDSLGNIIWTHDYGNMKKLNKLRYIRYISN